MEFIQSAPRVNPFKPGFRGYSIETCVATNRL